MKKMLVYAQWFYPEVASLAQLMTDLFSRLTDEYDITVICSIPCYTGQIEDKWLEKKVYREDCLGMHIVHVRVSKFDKQNKVSRVKHILSYFFASLRETFRAGRQDIVYTTTQPPILGGVLGVLGKWMTRGRLVYNIQDFNPEQTLAVNYMKSGIGTKLSAAADHFACRRSDLMILVGQDQVATLRKRLKDKRVPRYTVINNWIDDEQIRPLQKSDPRIVAFREQYGLSGRFVMMCSGNIGLFYDYENIIKVIAQFKKREDVVFAFVGEGAVRQKLMDYARENALTNVVFIPYQDKDALCYSLGAADVHIVANARGIKGVSVPSKIYGVLAAGVPVLGILEQDSEAWRIIAQSGCGTLCRAGDYEDIARAMGDILTQKEDYVRAHATGRAYLEAHLTRQSAVARYREALEQLLSEEPS